MVKRATIENNVRGMRARQFAAQVIDSLRDYLPTDGRTMQRIHDQLYEDAYNANALIVTVPPEFDMLSKLEAEREMRKRMMEPFTMKMGETIL